RQKLKGQQAKRKPITLSEYRDEYLSLRRTELWDSTRKTIHSAFNSIIHDVGDLPLEAITFAILYPCIHNDRRGVKWRRNIYTTINRAFDMAVRLRHITTNPLAGIPKPRGFDRDETLEWMSREEFESIMLRFKTNTPLQQLSKRVAIIAYEQGTRLGETVALRRADVKTSKESESMMTVTCSALHRTKNGKSRTIPLFNRARIAIEEQLEVNQQSEVEAVRQSELIFAHPITGEMPSVNYVSQQFRFARKAAFPDRSKVSFHTTRHSCCTNLGLGFVPPLEIRNIAGHSNLRTTLKYIHAEKMDFSKSRAVMDA
ncbi:MAG TPA: tyrosine-type recombinase/integrase, partial [Blastocatellia bacterium]|nr:tyrosine-type recombinase/integrase [Blastocatellia bacterium]